MSLSRVQACKSQLVLSVATLLRLVKNLVHWWQILEVLQLRPQKNAQSCGDSWTFTCRARLAHRACEKVEFLDRETPDFMSPCCLVLIRWTFSSANQIKFTIEAGQQPTSPVETSKLVWRQRYVTTSKKYLINCHILLKYFELVFLCLQLIQISCKLIVIWVNYKRKKKGLFMKHRVVYTVLVNSDNIS